jgi:hypothetical protein
MEGFFKIIEVSHSLFATPQRDVAESAPIHLI